MLVYVAQRLTISLPAKAADVRWDEINFETKEWKIPAARMKMKRKHTVPLCANSRHIYTSEFNYNYLKLE